MTDKAITLDHLRRRVAQFVAARNWEQFHPPKNLSGSIAIETAELMEHFQWLTDEQAAVALQDKAKLAAVTDELADVLIYALSLANALGVDVSAAVLNKLERSELRFPVEEWWGRV
ncbi:MAG: nucleotide pyrophosphohydrolase [Chloroflexi bacterium]|nr:nucleotide pyrophosphohydrolase [Chloroflexota bacterium]